MQAHPRYEIFGELRREEAATFYRAWDNNLKRYVAIKEMSLALRQDKAKAARFLAEAEFMARFDHPANIAVYDVDKERAWVIMELTVGTLADLLKEQVFPAELVESTLHQALEGLQFLHDKGKLHGNLHPRSLLVDSHGMVKLAEFTGVDVGGVMRRPSAEQKYIAPELLNPSFGRAGPGIDLYCLGFTALELLKGTKFSDLFTGVGSAAVDPRLAWLRWHGSPLERLPPVNQLLPALPGSLASLLDRLVTKEVDKRFASAKEALRALGDGPILRVRMAGVTGADTPPVPGSHPLILGTVGATSSETAGKSRRATRKKRLGFTRLELSSHLNKAPRLFEEDQNIVLGRDADCDLVLADGQVSKRHALIVFENERWRIYDLKSRNGVWIDNKRVTRGILRPTSSLRLGDFVVTVAIRRFRKVKQAEVAEKKAPASAGVALRSSMPARVGPFRIRDLIHEGSSGRLFTATREDHSASPLVVVKVFAPHLASNEDEMYRFCRGVTEAGKIRHTNILRLFKGGREGGIWYLAMEYAQRGSLRDLFAKRSDTRSLKPSFVTRFACDICAALEMAVVHHVIHRNLTPSSILFDINATAKLGDFTLMRGVVLETLQRFTQPGQAVGNFAYMSPEQTMGKVELDIRSDIYSLAATMYEALTGQPPFSGKNLVEVIEAVCHQPVEPLRRFNPAIPETLERLILKGLARNPAERFATPREFKEALRGLGLATPR